MPQEYLGAFVAQSQVTHLSLETPAPIQPTMARERKVVVRAPTVVENQQVKSGQSETSSAFSSNALGPTSLKPFGDAVRFKEKIARIKMVSSGLVFMRFL